MAPGQAEDSSQKEGAGAGPASWHFRTGVRVGVGVGQVLEWKRERGKETAQKCNTIYSGAMCGRARPGKENYKSRDSSSSHCSGPA